MELVVVRSIILSGLLCGSLGATLVSQELKTTCGNKYCCNPFHIIPQKIGVFVDHDSYAESFELQCQLHTLKQRVAEYVVEQALKEQEKMFEQEELDERANLTFDPDSHFSNKFEAVIEDMLAGRHSSQSSLPNPSSLEKPTDNEENATDDY